MDCDNTEKDFFEKIGDMPEIQHTKAISLMGNKNAYKKIVGISARLLPDNITRLNEFIETDLALYAIEIHGIKGVLKSIGADKLANKAYELEKLSKARDVEECIKRHSCFTDDMTDFLLRLNDVVDKPQKADIRARGTKRLRQALPVLKETAGTFNAAGAHDILSELAAVSFGAAMDALLNDLVRAFERFDFDKAADIIEKIETEI